MAALASYPHTHASVSWLENAKHTKPRRFILCWAFIWLLLHLSRHPLPCSIRQYPPPWPSMHPPLVSSKASEVNQLTISTPSLDQAQCSPTFLHLSLLLVHHDPIRPKQPWDPLELQPSQHNTIPCEPSALACANIIGLVIQGTTGFVVPAKSYLNVIFWASGISISGVYNAILSINPGCKWIPAEHPDRNPGKNYQVWVLAVTAGSSPEKVDVLDISSLKT
jgi:hypothetical protein